MKIDPADWAKVNKLLDEALERPMSEHADWLRTLPSECSEYEPLLRRLLSRVADAETRDFLDDLPSIDVALSPLPETDQHIGPYRLIRQLGAGGMASVWLAERTDGLIDRQIALKLPHPVLGTVFAQRAERERGFLAKLDHPNIARLYDAGVTDSGQPYLALEYVQGTPIDTYCDNNCLDIRTRVHLFRAVVDAMAHAHAKLIIHRDIKPGNILVDEDGKVRLLDFGIAKLLEHDNAIETELTRHSGRALTPAYAAPEHVQGDPLTVAADIYSLGVLLYELLAGQRPYAENDGSGITLEAAVLNGAPKRPSQKAANGADARALAGDLDVIVLKAMAREPERRYATCHAFGQDLQRYLTNEPVEARPDSTAYRLRKFVARHRIGVLTSVATVVVLMAATVVTTLQSIEATRQRDVALYQQQRASATMSFMSYVLEGVSADGAGITAPELLERATDMLDKQYRSQPFLASLYEAVAARYLGMFQTDRALELLKVSEDLAREDNDLDTLVDILCLTGRVQLRRVGDPETATAYLQEAEEGYSALNPPSRATYVQCARALAMFDRYRGDPDAGISRLEFAVDFLEADQTTDAFTRANVLNDLAVAYSQQNRSIDALNATEQAVATLEAGGRVDTVGWLTLQSNLANSLMTMGEVASALKLREYVQARAVELQMEGHSIVGYGTSYASNLYSAGHFDRSLDVAERTRAAAEAAGNNLVVAVSNQFAARALVALGEPMRAGPLFDRAEEFFTTSNRTANLLNLAFTRAEMHIALGNHEVAQQLLADVLAEQGYGEENNTRVSSLALSLASQSALATGDAAGAEQLADDSVKFAIMRARDPDTNASVGRALLFRGKARAQLGMAAMAIDDLTRARTAMMAGADPEHPYAKEAEELLAALGR